MKIMVVTLIALSSMVLSCTPRWNKDSCAQTDFAQLGYTEGSQGMDSKIDAYNSACLKKKVNIDTSRYNTSYQKGLSNFCSKNKAQASGASGASPHKNCLMIKHYMQSYEHGLKSFCTSERGVKDGYALKPKNALCSAYYAYKNGYKQGVKELCSYQKGQTDGFAGTEPHKTCQPYKTYSQGYAKGQSSFCDSKNGYRLGEKGTSFPAKCTSSAFRKSFNKGRVVYLERVIRSKETGITFERKNYEQIRDQIQDLQFSFQRLPKNSPDQNVLNEKAAIERKIVQLQKDRDKQLSVVTTIESDIRRLKNELNDIKE